MAGVGSQRTVRIISYHTSLVSCQSRGLVNIKSLYKSKPSKNDKGPEGGNTSYTSLMCKRRDEAQRSILVQMARTGTEHNLYEHLAKLGKIKKAFHYETEKSYLLVEFEKKASILNVYQDAAHFSSKTKVPIQSRMLFFERPPSEPKSEKFEINYHDMKFAKDLSHLKNKSSVSEQIQSHHRALCLDELGTRLRFFICSAVEDLISGLLPYLEIKPFGSSVNGFGWRNCDLDMAVMMIPSHMSWSEGLLKFLTKKIHEDERLYSQRSLAVLGSIISLALPCCYDVHKILNARVPIIKFHHQASNIACDLSFSNGTGEMMSEILYTLGRRDGRIVEVMSVIKHWARCKHLTKSSPGPWPTNFILLMLVVHYFQHCGIFPGIGGLTTGDGQSQKGGSRSADSIKTLEDLLKGFFRFYADFDFSSRAICLLEGRDFAKPSSSSPMVIQNPFELDLNICKNVSEEELERLKSEMNKALVTLESSSVQNETNWGIMKLFSSGDDQHNDRSTYDAESDVFREVMDSNDKVVPKFSVVNLYEEDTAQSELPPLGNSESSPLSTPESSPLGTSESSPLDNSELSAPATANVVKSDWNVG